MAPPEGFIYAENVVAAELWAELEAWLGSDASMIPWEVATEGRRVAQWGFRYDYSSHSVDETPVGSAANRSKVISNFADEVTR